MITKTLLQKIAMIFILLALFIVMLFFVLFSIVRCSGIDVQLRNVTGGSGSGANFHRMIVVQAGADLINPREYGANDTYTQVARGANEFAFNMTTLLLHQVEDDNFIFSPFSAWMPLVALANVTDETLQSQLLHALRVPGISVDELNQGTSRLLFDLIGENPSFADGNGSPLQLANAIFVDHGLTLNQEFAQLFFDYYRGATMTVDFESGETISMVNQWASDNTGGRIRNLVNQFENDTRLIVANAIYFADDWQTVFLEERTTEDVFYSPTGETTVPFMSRGGYMPYFEDDRIQAVSLNFSSGGSLLVMLPRHESPVDLLRGMSEQYFAEILSGLSREEGRLLLPRFTLESDEIDLLDALEILGVPLMNPIPGGITEMVEEENLFIGGGIQRAMIEVDERGATAAAVTFYDVEVVAEPEPVIPFEMNCNRPFAFILYLPTFDGGAQILFTGVVNQP